MNNMPRLTRNLVLLFGALCDLGLSLPDARHFLVSRDPDGVRKRLISAIKNPDLRREWEQIAAYRPSEFLDQFESTKNRLTKFISSPVVGPMLAAREAALNTRALMDESGVVLVDLSVSNKSFHPEQARVLGALLVNDFMLAARGREEGAPPFHLYIDECHRYLTSDFQDILFEARKFGLHLTLAHQDLSQLKGATCRRPCMARSCRGRKPRWYSSSATSMTPPRWPGSECTMRLSIRESRRI